MSHRTQIKVSIKKFVKNKNFGKFSTPNHTEIKTNWYESLSRAVAFDWRNNPLINCGLRYACGHVYISPLKKKFDEVIFYNWTHVVCFASYNSDASVANYELLLAVWGTNLWCFTDSKVTAKSIAFTLVLFRPSI